MTTATPVRIFAAIRQFWVRLLDPQSGLAPLRLRLAAVAGAILLALAATAFAMLGDMAQFLFLAAIGRAAWVEFVLPPLGFALCAWLTVRFWPEARGSGIPQVIAAVEHPTRGARAALVSLRTAMAKFWLTLGMLLAGGSVGREGPTVQISAAIMVAVHRLLRVPVGAGVLIAGGAAGVSAAFNTPLAGVSFAIEELASAYEQRVTMLVMSAVMVAGLVTLGISGDYVYFGAMQGSLSLRAVLIVAPLAGVLGGLAGGLFSLLLIAFARQELPVIKAMRARPVLLAFGCGAVVALCGWLTHNATWGTGYAMTRSLIEDHPGSEPLFGIAKFVSTAATALSGAPGGIFAPSLSTGAGLGQMLAPLFPDQPAGAIVLLGMAGYFVGVVRAPLTAVIILMETTASRSMIVPLFATALIADFVSAQLCPEKLYHALSRNFSLKPAARP